MKRVEPRTDKDLNVIVEQDKKGDDICICPDVIPIIHQSKGKEMQSV